MKNLSKLGLLLLVAVAACGSDESVVTHATDSATGVTSSVQAGAPATAPAFTPGASNAASATPAAPAQSAAPPARADAAPSGPAKPDGSAASVADAGWCGVKRTLDGSCTVCHNEQKTAGAPMSLKTYADLQAPALSDKTRKVYQLVGVRVHDKAKPMPPQGALTAEQLNGLDTWVAAGAPAGTDPTCASTTKPAIEGPTSQDGWQWPSNCDATYKVLAHAPSGNDAPYMVPANQEIHPQVSVAAPWGNEKLQAIAFRAITDNPKVLHHWILYGSNREHLMGWAPGKDHNAPVPDDVGMNLPGGQLTLDMHYYNLMNGQAEPDRSGVEICVLKPEHFRKNTAAVYGRFAQFSINLPAHSKDMDVTGTCTVGGNTPVTLLSASPHAHTFATHMKFSVQKASGETIVMHDKPFDFMEQTTYALEKPVVLNAGDKVITTCTFSNTSDATVTFGENTGNEMCFNFATYYPMGMLSCTSGFPGVGGR
jgi:hypothetical protein